MADLDEVLRLLTVAARAGVVTAMVALLRYLAAQGPAEGDDEADPFAELDGQVVRLHDRRPEAS